ncbi:MAG: phosphoribosylaminoimidazolesuccinocarboxamide synthase, partial [Bacteroidales bacterium]
AEYGDHDEDISGAEIISRGIIEKKLYEKLAAAAIALFNRGNEVAAERGLILVDTKYEFGILNGEPMLIDEIHTPDSSRYFYAADYEERFKSGLEPRQLSKEFVREWLMDNGFSGKAGEKVPEMTLEKVQEISERYIELYENLTGRKFVKTSYENAEKRIEDNVNNVLERLK